MNPITASTTVDYSYLTRGVYVDQTRALDESVPKEQLLVMCSEDLRREPSRVLQEVLQFLELPAWEPQAQNNYGQAEYPKMDAAVRARLIEYFQPHNRRLHDFLGRDFGWDR